MNNFQYILILFQSTHHAIKAERIFAKTGLNYRVIPVPQEISADCGSSLRTQELKKALQLIRENQIKTAGIYEVYATTDELRYKKYVE